MNQLCKVCGEPAAGFHFGAFTCEGCKSFFGRTYNNISAIAGCKNNGDCVINKKNRTACKACRLRKCLLVGMSKSGSRYGRRSNWFKIHCLLQEQQTNSGNSQQNSSANTNNLEQLARLHQIHARQTYQDKTNPCIKSAIGQQQAALTLPPASNVETPHSLTNFLNPAKFFNGSDANTRKITESRQSDTPSDSGASSAGDPTDDCTSNQSIRQNNHQQHQHQQQQQQQHQSMMNLKTQRNCNSAHQSLNDSQTADDEDSDERERRRQQFLQIFRSHSEPLSPFVPFHFTQHLPPPAPHILSGVGGGGTPPATFILPAVLKHSHESLVKQEAQQEEPIDLSLKSRHSQTPESPRKSTSPELLETASNEAVNVITKTTPLDLTLMRTTQTLTG